MAAPRARGRAWNRLTRNAFTEGAKLDGNRRRDAREASESSRARVYEWRMCLHRAICVTSEPSRRLLRSSVRYRKSSFVYCLSTYVFVYTVTYICIYGSRDELSKVAKARESIAFRRHRNDISLADVRRLWAPERVEFNLKCEFLCTWWTMDSSIVHIFLQL